MGHLYEADVWPLPWTMQIWSQVEDLILCWVERQVGQTWIPLHFGSPLWWSCLRHTEQYFGVICTLRDLFCFLIMQWSRRVSVFMKAWARSGVRNDTCMALGADRVSPFLCWIRWMFSMLGSEFIRFVRKSSHASARVRGGSVSQNRNRLSGKLSTNMVESSASRGGGRILRFSLLRFD